MPSFILSAVTPKYLVAFSLAGEQHDLVLAIAKAAKEQLGEGRVFFYEWFQHLVAGQDADLKLQKIYGEECALVVLCVSASYGKKSWTLLEYEAIRDRYYKARASGDAEKMFAVLPIRVGDGDIPGLTSSTTVAPDARELGVAAAVKLIIDRLREIDPDLVPAAAPVDSWPQPPKNLIWPMADHTHVRTAFAKLLTRDTPERCLLLRGKSEAGKSHITKQMHANGLAIEDLGCGRLDLKGTTEIALDGFVQDLGIDTPAPAGRLSERLGEVLGALRERKRPSLLIFDTYEAAAGETEEWMGTALLPALVRSKWLRVVIAGQRTPERAGAAWELVSAPVMEVIPPQPEDWYTFGKQHHADLDFAFVKQAVVFSSNKASLLSELLGPST